MMKNKRKTKLKMEKEMPYINLLGTFIFIVIGYLIGSISPSIIISKKKFKTDIRYYHSKNAGATNSTRIMGKK